MSSIIKETVTYVICPHCGNKDSTLDHIIGKYDAVFGPWYCKSCNNAYGGEVKSGEIYIKKEKTIKINTLNLLKIETKEYPVYLVLKGMRFIPDESDKEEVISNAKYFYDEHSCPTNWLKNTLCVSVGGDADPHGFAKFVKCKDYPENFNEDDSDWSEIFSELG